MRSPSATDHDSRRIRATQRPPSPLNAFASSHSVCGLDARRNTIGNAPAIAASQVGCDLS